MNTKTAAEYRAEGSFFQLPMIALWLLQSVYIPKISVVGWSWEPITNYEVPYSFIGSIITYAGFLLMLISMLRIYKKPSENEKPVLITSDIFSLTRHPMYHGMFIANLDTFLTSNLQSITFWVSWIIFTFLIMMAGWYQEKETLARWGEEAEEYYRKTPRFIFQWIWFRRPKDI